MKKLKIFFFDALQFLLNFSIIIYFLKLAKFKCSIFNDRHNKRILLTQKIPWRYKKFKDLYINWRQLSTLIVNFRPRKLLVCSLLNFHEWNIVVKKDLKDYVYVTFYYVTELSCCNIVVIIFCRISLSPY